LGSDETAAKAREARTPFVRSIAVRGNSSYTVADVIESMAMGTRKSRERQKPLWVASKDVVEPPGNVFYDQFNQVLERHQFDRNAEAVCRKFCRKSRKARMGDGRARRTRMPGSRK
jgi:hypothetical protein